MAEDDLKMTLDLIKDLYKLLQELPLICTASLDVKDLDMFYNLLPVLIALWP